MTYRVFAPRDVRPLPLPVLTCAAASKSAIPNPKSQIGLLVATAPGSDLCRRKVEDAVDSSHRFSKDDLGGRTRDRGGFGVGVA